MDKRKNLRNPDSLAYDYVSVLLNWITAASLSTTPTFTVSKVLGGTFPFNANMLSFTSGDSSSTISFTFASPFDINTSPWQFELEVAFVSGISKFRPHAVYNGSNNQITVKFNVSNLTATTSYPLVFTAKRYRPTAEYLAQLATASQNPVTVGIAGSTSGTTPVAANTGLTIPLTGSFTAGYQFTAPTNFTLTSVTFEAPAGVVGSSLYGAFVDIIRYTTTFPVSPGVNTGFTFITELAIGFPISSGNITMPAGSIAVNTGQIIALFISMSTGSNINNTISQGIANNYSTNIAGIPVTLSRVTATTNILQTTIFPGGTTYIYSEPSALYIPRISFAYTTAGGTAWSNIIY